MALVNGINTTSIVKCIGVGIGNIVKMSGETFSNSPSPPPGIVTDSLQIHWDIQNTSSYPGTGTTVTDLQGNNNGTLSGSPLYSVVGGANSLRFTGSQIASFATSIAATNWTTSYWIRYYGSNTYYHRIFGMSGYRLELAFTNNSLYIYDGGWFNTSINLNSTSEWHKLTVTYTNSPRTIKVYKNGVQVYSTGRGRTIANTAYFMNSSDRRRAKGYIGDFMHYNKALSAAEELQNYDALKSTYGR
mgnify:CR=1 FL=1|tara:strand:+ start:806 stop:1540 length:735 start_codon:yes stop_codon:yes gene_type:complete